MPRKKQIKPENRIVMDAAVGISAWVLVIEAMIMLEKRGILRRKDNLRIIVGAAAAVKVLASETNWHPAFPVAIEMLEEQAAVWSKNKG